MIIADAPCRAFLLNHQTWGGRFGCNWCDIETVRYAGAQRYPVNQRWSYITNEEWRRIVGNFENLNDEQRKGIKGSCALLDLPYVDISVMCHPEYLHAILLGVVKMSVDMLKGAITLIQAVITSRNVATVNEIFEQIKYPVECGRSLALFLSKHKWKASDYENFIFHGFVALIPILSETHLEFFKQLSFIVTKFCSDQISISDLRTVKDEIHIFLQNFTKTNFDSLVLQRYNLHTLNHLEKTINVFGPMPLSSAFPSESWMGVLKNHVKSFSNVATQVARKATIFSSITAHCTTNLSSYTNRFRQLFFHFFPHLKSYSNVATNCNTPVVNSKLILSDLEKDVIITYFNVDSIDDISYNLLDRIHYNNFILTTRNYNDTIATKSRNNCIITTSGKFIEIIHILYHLTSSKYFLLVYEFNRPQHMKIHQDMPSQTKNLDHIFVSQSQSQSLIVIPLGDIREYFTYVKINATYYLFKNFNRHL